MVKKKEFNPKVQWAKFIGVLVLYLLFLYWVGSWWGLLVIPFIFDVYITKKIKWQWWKEAEKPVKFVMSWIDALVFALVAVYFINQFFFQNYVIPSSSLEKSLLTGDYLFVSKVSYGPRIPQTPLTMPLTQHTLPVVECKSYIEWPHWDYRRVKGLGQVQLNDIVVFNYPAGDTICTALNYQTEYYNLCYGYGYPSYPNMPNLDSLSAEKRLQVFSTLYEMGKNVLQTNPQEFGEIATRPTDRRENYVKRCVGLPGQTLQIKDHIIYLDGKANKEPENVQYTYNLKLKRHFTEEELEEWNITREELVSLNNNGYATCWRASRSTMIQSSGVCIHKTATTTGLAITMVQSGFQRRVHQSSLHSTICPSTSAVSVLMRRTIFRFAMARYSSTVRKLTSTHSS